MLSLLIRIPHLQVLELRRQTNATTIFIYMMFLPNQCSLQVLGFDNNPFLIKFLIESEI